MATLNVRMADGSGYLVQNAPVLDPEQIANGMGLCPCGNTRKYDWILAGDGTRFAFAFTPSDEVVVLEYRR